MTYEQIENALTSLSDEEIINLLLILSKKSSDRDIIKTKNAITLALKNAIFFGDSEKSLGYENVAFSFGLSFREVEQEVAKFTYLKETIFGTEFPIENTEGLFKNMFIVPIDNDEVYH